jgi:very-short-patch-repair endonuclease
MRSMTDEGSRAQRDGFEPCRILSDARKHDAMTSDIPAAAMLRLAREQRATQVQAETLVWRAVRDRRCESAKFRRQAPIGKFIVDFVCYERRLIVEVDGPSHDNAEQQEKDREREAWLEEQGFRILRLPNELVIAATELAVARIRAALSG